MRKQYKGVMVFYGSKILKTDPIMI